MATSTVSPSAPAATVVKKPRRRKLVIVLVVVLALAVVGGVAAYFLIDYFKPVTAAKAPRPPPAVDPIYVALAPLTVNLQPNDKHRFLHVGVTLKVADAKAQAMVNQYLPEVTSRVLLVLANRQSESLVTNEDKGKLAAEALAVLTQPFGPNLPALKISSVMFPVFMFQ
jgi:flagellar FliL protein